MTYTADQLKEMKFRGPVVFGDGANGMARQEFVSVGEPRFGYVWQRKDRKDKGRQFYTVDGEEVKDFAEAAVRLALPPDPNSAEQKRQRSIDEFRFSPSLDGRATRAFSEARMNADVGPFAMLRAWYQRVENAWHGGINDLSDTMRKRGEDFPHWLYNVKTAGYEFGRLMYLLEDDEAVDKDTRCALGVRVRDCEILKHIADNIAKRRAAEKFPCSADDVDVLAVKAFTCVGHVLAKGADRHHDHGFMATKEQRNMRF